MRKINIKNGIIEDIFVYEDRVRECEEEYNNALKTHSVSDDAINEINSRGNENLTNEDKSKLSERQKIDDDYNKKLEYLNSCYELVEISYDGKEFDEEIYTLVPQFKIVNNTVEQTYKSQLDRHKILQKISELKKKLADTDYIVIKSYEARLSNEDMPYTQKYMDEVFSERKALREKINYLDDLIK